MEVGYFATVFGENAGSSTYIPFMVKTLVNLLLYLIHRWASFQKCIKGLMQKKNIKIWTKILFYKKLSDSPQLLTLFHKRPF